MWLCTLSRTGGLPWGGGRPKIAFWYRNDGRRIVEKCTWEGQKLGECTSAWGTTRFERGRYAKLFSQALRIVRHLILMRIDDGCRKDAQLRRAKDKLLPSLKTVWTLRRLGSMAESIGLERSWEERDTQSIKAGSGMEGLSSRITRKWVLSLSTRSEGQLPQKGGSHFRNWKYEDDYYSYYKFLSVYYFYSFNAKLYLDP